jgi:putative transposase
MRKPRIYYPGAVYHVVLRGNAGQNVFFTEKDKKHFYRLLDEGQEKYGHLIHAFCLMANHIHLVLQVGNVPLSRILQNISQRYTMWVNRQRKRMGHLFQGRYKAILVDADTYLLELVRYIHLNPVRAKIVKAPGVYHWSSYNAYLGRESFPWLTTDWVLEQFSKRKAIARKTFEAFVYAGIGEERRQDFHSGTRNDGILGNQEFYEKVHRVARDRVERRVKLEEIIKRVCDAYGVSEGELLSQGKQRGPAKARAMVCWLVRETSYLSLSDLSKKLRRDISGLSIAARRLEERSRMDERLAARMVELKKISTC